MEIKLKVKRILDFIGSLISLVYFSPVFLLISILIKIESAGPVFYRQIRVGKDGHKFEILKFRTLKFGSQEEYEDFEKGLIESIILRWNDEDQLTEVGKFLQKSSLDEMPQLINILKGDMSFIGPRPSLQFEVEHYEEWQKERLKVKPGMTGLSQISKKELNYEDKVRIDIQYANNYSLWLDLKILLLTIPRVLIQGKV